MAEVENRTPFKLTALQSLTREGRDCLAVYVAGSFDIPAAIETLPADLARSEEQMAPPLQDVFVGEPWASSLYLEAQTAYHRQGTDVYIHGHAWSEGGQPARESRVQVQVGSLKRTLQVYGDRVWTGVADLRPSTPVPFVSMPLQWERSFGGRSAAGARWEPRNPIGRGLYASHSEARDSALPNLEDPDERIRSWSDAPTPAGVSPIARDWQPRLGYAGTYDEAWRRQRAPLWPEDMDLRFFQAAAPGLSTRNCLRGGEPVLLDGFSPDGAIGFLLPVCRLLLHSYFRDHSDRRPMVMDALLLDLDERRLILFWRATVPAHRQMALHRHSVVRELESWEPEP